LLHDPQLLILDEPASDLDPRARIEIRDLLLELRDLGKTIFLSSHILSELSDVCTSVGIIEKGQLLVAGPIATIAEQLRERQHAGAPGPAPSYALSAAPVAVGDADVSPAPQLTPGGTLVPSTVQHRLKLRALGDTFRLKPLLAACPPITQIDESYPGQVTISYVGDTRFVADLVRYLVSHGIDLVAVEPERNELERIFLEVTRGRLQ
jgi:ABC-2 type transport system ATP-binding protein